MYVRFEFIKIKKKHEKTNTNTKKFNFRPNLSF